MKKTLTVNLAGFVFHIDEDAYRLLDNYLNNLRLHFNRRVGVDEIIGDIEQRIADLFTEKLNTGKQVISIADVEEIIARIGQPEQMENNAADDEQQTSTDRQGTADGNTYTTHRKFYRNPDDKVLGGVAGGLAAYLGCDATALRLLFVLLLIVSAGISTVLYVVCWLIAPEAHTAAEKLSMRGEAVTIENIGKTVTDGFGRVYNGVNDYIKSDRPRTTFQRIGDGLVSIIGFCLKVLLVILALCCSPLLLVFIIVFVSLIFAAVTVAIGGGATLLAMFPMIDWTLPAHPLPAIVMYIACVLLAGIPLVSIVFYVLRLLFDWKPMPVGLKRTLVALWAVSLVVFFVCFAWVGYTWPMLCLYL
ncbi:MAG: PspC domain-containing protein [Prevotellaceae bacterium]|jgi:phage shock protein PspC (stress-responsive transcriptional regulator)|nr:PspC domain-containing protein [Prevotellaceae bacterium]